MTTRDDARYRRDFRLEAEPVLDEARGRYERLAAAGAESDPNDLNALFRAVHSLKGSAAMVGLTGLSETAHALEALLDALRMGRVPLDTASLAATRDGLSALAELTVNVGGESENPASSPEVVEALKKAAAPRQAAPETAAPSVALPQDVTSALTDYERHRLQENVKKGRDFLLVSLEFPFDGFDEGLRNAMAEAGSRGELIGTFPGAASSPDSLSFRLLVGVKPGTEANDLGERCKATSVERFVTQKPAAPAAAPAPLLDEALAKLGGTVRVPLQKLNQLLDVAGELALARSALEGALERHLASPGDRTARTETQRTFRALDRAVTVLGRAALAARLVPIEQLTSRLARTSETIAASLGKEASFRVVGGETEIDKVLADQLQDPLLHLLRNALDHGIEPPAERVAAGKPREGRVTLSAAARGRAVVLKLADDGRGIRADELVARSREKGLLREGEPLPADPLELIFRPGFSTASAVSELSGRGVGLDVVRSNIATLKGSVSVRSTPGAGAEFVVVVPMTLALVESLLVKASGRTFALPSADVLRTFRYDRSRTVTRAGRTLMEEDGISLALFPLGSLLGLPDEKFGRNAAVVVSEQGDRRAGFIVSSIEGIRDVMVKTLPDDLPRASEVTGTAELPGGELALALDTGLLLSRVAGAAA